MFRNQTIILIHGAGSIGGEWGNFVKKFKAMGNNVINPTLRYHRRGYNSNPKLGNTSISDYVSDIEKIIKKLDKKPIIIGYSMGGLIALILCSKGYSTETNKLTQKTILETAKASLARAEYEISKLIIKAPFAGILENNTAEIGSFLNIGSLCATIIDLSEIKLIGYIPELKIREISLGSDAYGTTVSGITTKGRVSFISKQADTVTKTFRVEILADNNDELIRDGETIEIRINLESNKAHLLPQSVLTLNDEGDLGVRTVVNKTVEFFKVKILRDQKNGLLLTGLPDNVDVITVGQEFVVDGQQVNISYE